jgi:putative N6-adenine-specific DNA methylase
MEENFRMIAKCFFGFEEILEKELRDLGAQDVEKGVRMVSFKGDKGFMYKANLSLRTALKVLKPIYSF